MLHPLPPLALERLDDTPPSISRLHIAGNLQPLNLSLYRSSESKIMAEVSNPIQINDRINVPSFLRKKNATKMDIVKSPISGKLFFHLDNEETTTLPDGRTVKGTRGAISKSLQEELAAGNQLRVSEIVVGDTERDGKQCWLLMKASESNAIQTIGL